LLGAIGVLVPPAHVSSVAWAAGIQEQLVRTLSLLLAVIALLGRRAEERPRAAVGLATVAFVAALLSKEVGDRAAADGRGWAWPGWRRGGRAGARALRPRSGRSSPGSSVGLPRRARRRCSAGSRSRGRDAPGWPRRSLPCRSPSVTYLKMLVWPAGFSFFRPSGRCGLPRRAGAVSIGIVALLAVGLVVAARRVPRSLLPAPGSSSGCCRSSTSGRCARSGWSPTATSSCRRWRSPGRSSSCCLAARRRRCWPAALIVRRPRGALCGDLRDERTFYAAMARAEPTSSFVAAEQAPAAARRRPPHRARRRRCGAPSSSRRKEPDNLRALGDLEARVAATSRPPSGTTAARWRRSPSRASRSSSSPWRSPAPASASAHRAVEERRRRWPDGLRGAAHARRLPRRRRPADRAEAAFAAASRLRPGDPALAGGLDATLARLAPMLLPDDPAR
jgi:hypothetical protein